MTYPQTFNNVIQLNVKFKRNNRSVKDYTRDYQASIDLVKRLLHYYHSKGFTQVKIWIEPRVLESGRKDYDIRSNISFVVPQ